MNVKNDQVKLKSFSEEHLYYEILMLYGVSDLLQKGEKEFFYYNALLESFVIHASIILDFFYKPQIKPDDAKAVHFISDVKRWKMALPPFDKYFRKFNRKRNREVVHLSYKRLEVKPHDKRWYSSMVVKQLRKIVDLFLTMADPQLLHSRMYKLKSGELTLRKRR